MASGGGWAHGRQMNPQGFTRRLSPSTSVHPLGYLVEERSMEITLRAVNRNNQTINLCITVLPLSDSVQHA